MVQLLPFMLTLMGIGTGVQAYGQYKSGQAAKRAAKEAADLERYNAQVAEGQAKDAEMRGQLDAQRQDQITRGVIGTQRAGFAAQGVDVGSGSAADVQADAAYLGELDKQTILNNAAREALGYQQDAERHRRGARYAAASGQAASTASKYAMAGTILGGGAQAVSLLQARYGWGSR